MRDRVFREGATVAGFEVSEFSAPRVGVLMRRGNKLFSDNPKDQDEATAAAEVFYVLTRGARELAQMNRLSQDDWDTEVDAFMLEQLTDDRIREIGAALKAELELLEEESVRAVMTPGKEEGQSPPPEEQNQSGCQESSPPDSAADSPGATSSEGTLETSSKSSTPTGFWRDAAMSGPEQGGRTQKATGSY